MTTAEKITKLGELIRQARALETAIKESGLDDDLIKDALEDASETGIELGASRIVLTKLQRQLEAA